MPSIRFSTAADPLLRFCSPADDRACPDLFSTYAELITFAASLGYHENGGGKPTSDIQSLKTGPDPVDLGIFRRQRMHSTLLLLGLACDKNIGVAKDEERLCRIVEGYAHDGFIRMQTELQKTTPSSFHQQLIDLMRDAADGVEQVTI